jgi:C4-dicarboxylate transporter, DctQ subunit
MIAIRTIDNFLAGLERFAVVILFVSLIGIILVNILGRNLLHISFDALFEFAPVMVLWLSLLGASLAMRSERHIKLELLLRFCPPWVRQWAFAGGSLFGMAVMAVLFAASISFFKEELSIFGGRGWLSLITPLFFGLMTFRYLVRFLNVFSSTVKPS